MRGDEITRRSFLKRLAGRLGIAALAAWAAYIFYGAIRYLTPRRLWEPRNEFKAGYPDQYRPGTVSSRWAGEPYKVWLVRKHTGEFYALYNECTHLQCSLAWDPSSERFRCPCHGSEFDLEGKPLKGPASKALERVHLKLDVSGQILVDTSKRFRLEEGEWGLPGSYLNPP